MLSSTPLKTHQVFDARQLNQASSFFQSSQTAAAAPGLGQTTDFYSLSSECGGLDHLMTPGIDSNMLSTSYVNQYHSPQGCSFNNQGAASYANNMFSPVGKTPVSAEVITYPGQMQNFNAAYPFNNQGIASRFFASGGSNMFSPVGKSPIPAGVITSPEQISSITACSDGDLHSDGEHCDGGTTFPLISLNHLSQSPSQNYFPAQQVDQGVLDSVDRRFLETNQNDYHEFFPMASVEYVEQPYSILEEASERIPQGSYSLSSEISGDVISNHEDLLQYQGPQFNRLPSLLMFNDLSNAQSREVTSENYCDNYTLNERSLKLNQFSVGQEYDIRQQQPSVLKHVGASSVANTINLPIWAFLLLYIRYKNNLQNEEKTQATFLKKWHKIQCQDKKCKCDVPRTLICHYESCSYRACSICKPVRDLCSADTVQSGFRNLLSDPLKAIHERVSIGSVTSTVESNLPPPKRMRMEECFSYGNVPSALAADSTDKSFRSEGTSQYKQWSEGPLFNKENEEVMKLEQLCSPGDPIEAMKKEQLYYATDPLRASVTTHHTPGNTQRLACGNAPFLPEELNCETSNCDGLNNDILPVLKHPNVVQEKGEMQSMSKPNQPESKAKADSREAAIVHQSETSLEDPRKLPVSLVDFLNSMQIKEHICSLSQPVGQRITTESNENALDNCVGENTCQLCNMGKLVFSPAPLYCSRCGFPIKHNLIYYWALDEMGSRHCFCTRCFKESRGGRISIQGFCISKAQLQKKKNNEENEEPWVQCDKCERWQHQICGLYNAKIDTEGKAKYICPNCRLEEIKNGEHVPLPSAFGAKDLPRTKLSDHIEERLFRQLKREREERAKFLSKDFDEVPGTAELVVRVVLSVNKLLRVNQSFLEIFPGENYPEEFPYKSKVILLFQKIEGVDVCIFGVYVQEFGSECGNPNQRCIYISYLDSVKYFRPEIETVSGEALRTFVYQEILIGYLDYCKKQGFATCYIWSCPPVKGDNYILYCHPEAQKTPKSEKLRQWYKSLLKKAAEEDIVVDYTTLYDRFFIPNGECSTKITAARLPYFDGDYWSGAAEEMIRDMGKPKGEIKRKVKHLTKRTMKAMGHNDLTTDATKDMLVMQKLGQTISSAKEDYLVVHLLFTCKNCHDPILSGAHWFCNQCKNYYLCSRCLTMGQNLNEMKTHTSNGGEEHLLSQVVVNDIPADTSESDVVLDNAILENRHSFLSFCQGNHYQFNTLRRAKHSSMMILYDLHKTTCSICFKDIMAETGWHCEICPNFDGCITCYHKSGGVCHNHKLIPHLRKADFGVNEDQAQQEKVFQVVVVNTLSHASRCHATRSYPCSYPLCDQTRKLFHHSSQCEIRTAGGCKFCRKVWKMIYIHSWTCKDPICPVPRCVDVKEQRAEICSRMRKRDAIKCLDTG
ncbi:hypothetical protein ACH5RR_011342 [Cinchona calisaya]|uniref:histone acetyltransferase n=1 Tax=Cinchona calisaya TaxID=153742 RepID=A0ABD3A4K6_9GENT